MFDINKKTDEPYIKKWKDNIWGNFKDKVLGLHKETSINHMPIISKQVKFFEHKLFGCFISFVFSKAGYDDEFPLCMEYETSKFSLKDWIHMFKEENYAPPIEPWLTRFFCLDSTDNNLLEDLVFYPYTLNYVKDDKKLNVAVLWDGCIDVSSLGVKDWQYSFKTPPLSIPLTDAESGTLYKEVVSSDIIIHWPGRLPILKREKVDMEVVVEAIKVERIIKTDEIANYVPDFKGKTLLDIESFIQKFHGNNTEFILKEWSQIRNELLEGFCGYLASLNPPIPPNEYLEQAENSLKKAKKQQEEGNYREVVLSVYNESATSAINYMLTSFNMLPVKELKYFINLTNERGDREKNIAYVHPTKLSEYDLGEIIRYTRGLKKLRNLISHERKATKEDGDEALINGMQLLKIVKREEFLQKRKVRGMAQ